MSVAKRCRKFACATRCEAKAFVRQCRSTINGVALRPYRCRLCGA